MTQIYGNVIVEIVENVATITKGDKTAEIVFGKKEVKPVYDDKAEIASDERILSYVKSKVIENHFGRFTKDVARLALDGKYDQVMDFLRKDTDKRIHHFKDKGEVVFGNTVGKSDPKNGFVKIIEKAVSETYHRHWKGERQKRTKVLYKRTHQYFTINGFDGGDDKYEFSHGADNETSFAEMIPYILESSLYADRYNGLKDFRDCMEFMEEFGYCSCGDASDAGVKVVEAIRSQHEALNLGITEYDFEIGLWVGQGVDEKLVEKGYIPEDEADYYELWGMVKFKDSMEDDAVEMQLGFYEPGENPEDDPKDEEIFYLFEFGDTILGDHDDFIIESIKWRN